VVHSLGSEIVAVVKRDEFMGIPSGDQREKLGPETGERKRARKEWVLDKREIRSSRGGM
jgi:hypothetical protein